MGHAKLYFNYGAMGSSKTAQALMARFNYEEKGKNALMVKPEIDTRGGKDIVESRIGLKHECVSIQELVSLYRKSRKALSDFDIVIVDEAQFLKKEEVDILVEIVDKLNIPVMCYGLLSDFKGDLFEGSSRLIVMADKLTEIKTICWCGRKATFNARFDEKGRVLKSGEQVVIGANDKYTSLCRKHWIEGNLGNTIATNHEVHHIISEFTPLNDGENIVIEKSSGSETCK